MQFYTHFHVRFRRGGAWGYVYISTPYNKYVSNPIRRRIAFGIFFRVLGPEVLVLDLAW